MFHAVSKDARTDFNNTLNKSFWYLKIEVRNRTSSYHESFTSLTNDKFGTVKCPRTPIRSFIPTFKQFDILD